MIDFSTFICGGAFGLIAILLVVKSVRVAVRRGAAQCARCGYPTPSGRDPEVVRCPECGDLEIVHPVEVAFRRPMFAALLCALLAITKLVLDGLRLSPWRLALRAMPDAYVMRLAGAQHEQSAAEDEFRRRRTWATLSDQYALDAWLDDAASWSVDSFFVVRQDGATLLGKLWVVPPWGGRTPTDYHVFVRASNGAIVATRPLREDLQGRTSAGF